MMNSEITKLIGLPYSFKNSPHVSDKTEKVNCQKTVHLLYKLRFGVELPKGMWSKEIFEDEMFIFRNVNPNNEKLFEGDIFIFGSPKNRDSRSFHLSYFTGSDDEYGSPLLIHANVYDQMVSVWPLRKFFHYSRYGQLKKVKRLKQELFETIIIPITYDLKC